MTEPTEAKDEEDLMVCSLGKVFLKDASLEAPNSPEAFLGIQDIDPKVTLQFKIDEREVSEDTYSVVLTLTITAADEPKTLFLIEVQQGGVFLIRGYDSPERLERILKVRCPKMLFPYARETVDNLIVKAGFPPLMLAPVDFTSAYTRKTAAAAGA